MRSNSDKCEQAFIDRKGKPLEGKHVSCNIVPACLRCNLEKLDAMPNPHEEMPEGFNLELSLT